MRIAGLILVTVVVLAVFFLTGGLDSTSQSDSQQAQQTQPQNSGLSGL